MRITIPVAAAALLLAACSTVETLPEADGPAAALYRARCGSCHALPHPARHRADEWPPLLALMERRMAERGYPPLSGEERRILLGYLRRHAR